MKKLILCLFMVVFANLVFSQWERIKTIDRTDYDNYYYKDLISPSPEKVFYSVYSRLTSNSDESNFVKYSLDGGVNWDSLIFNERGINTLNYLNEDFIYIVTFDLVYLPNQSPYSRKYLNLSVDGGISWTERLIDSTSNGMGTNALTFFNDSVAIIREQIGCCTHQFYQSNDQGENWHPVEYPNYKIAAPFKNSGILMSGQSIAALDFQQESYSDDYYSCLGEGSVSSFDVNGNKLLRSVSGHDGPEQGYPNNNYLILSIHDTELSNQKVLHYPSIGSSPRICYNGSQINIVGGVAICSKDDGDSFFIQEVNDPEELYLTFVDFSNEEVGYALSRNLETNIWQLLKTTNGGGTTTNFLPPPIVKLAENGELDEISFSISPNPCSDKIIISSEERISQVVIYQLDGKQVLSEKSNTMSLSISLAHFKSGSYIVEIHTEKGKITKKLIKL